MKVNFEVNVECCTGEFRMLSNFAKLQLKQFIKNCKPDDDETTVKGHVHSRRLTGNETTVRRPY